MHIPILDEKQLFDTLRTKKNPFFKEYYAFYSSWFGGIITDPHLMVLPMDDHMVHRGDGVFEAMKAEGRSVYLMEEHLQRLFFSAEKIALVPPFDFNEIKEIILQTLKVVDRSDVFIRLFISRGPGNFSVNPYDSVGSQLYVIINRLTTPALKKYEEGVIIGKSHIPAKPSWMAQVKSCNYLPNVLMRKEALDRDLDFVVGADAHGHVTESATENIMLVDQKGILVHPILDHILKGTTMMRACELANEKGIVVEKRPVLIDELKTAREIIITGTTLNILPVVQFENFKIGNGKPGPITKQLQTWLVNDIQSGRKGIAF